MRNIQESFIITQSIADSINGIQVDEGIKEIFNVVKDKFKKVYSYLKKLVVKIGCYYLPVDNQGEIIPAVTPMTSIQAYKDGQINKKTVLVVAGKEESKITGKAGSVDDFEKIYDKGNSLQYWKSIYNESKAEDIANVNEVMLEPTDDSGRYTWIKSESQLKKIIMAHINAGPKFPTLFIWGAPGIGKTAIVKTVAETMKSKYPNYTLLFHTLSHETPDNFLLPKYTDDGRATDVPKTWMPVYKPTGDPIKDKEADEALGHGLLFFDEFSRARPDVHNVMLPVINEHEFQDWKIGSGWTVICASNRLDDDEYGTPMSKTMLSRTAQVHYIPGFESWKPWAEKQNYISPLLLDWLSMGEADSDIGGGKYFYYDPDHGKGKRADKTTVMCSPRTWANAMAAVYEYAKTAMDEGWDMDGWGIFEIPEYVIRMGLNTAIPADVIDAFWSFLETIKSIGSIDRLCDDIWRRGKAKSIDDDVLRQLKITLAQMVLAYHGRELPTGEEFVNLAKWVCDTGNDQLCALILDNFFNIFFVNKGAPTKRDSHENIMLIKFFVDKKKAKPTYVRDELKKWKPCFDNWGVKLDWNVIESINDNTDPDDVINALKELPDYSKGTELLYKKFGKIFQASTIDGVSALG